MTQPPPPYQPQQYPNPYQQPGKGGRTAVIVIVVIVVLVVLFCGGIIAGGIALVRSADDAVDHMTSQFDSHRKGGPDNPITVREGQAFTIDGMRYDAGWQVVQGRGPYADEVITGLNVKNQRDDGSSERASLEFTFLVGDREVGEIDCYSDGDIGRGHSELLDCSFGDGVQGKWDSIEVNSSI